MKVVFGLRNPGSEYAGTRHNVGTEVLAALALRHDGRFRPGPLRLRSELASVRLSGEKVLLAAATTYMNQSGASVRAVLDYHKVGVDDLLVIHDDIDLDFGRLRLQRGGGTGGHNGLKSIRQHLSSDEFDRLKIGVGRPPGSRDPADYVLSRFTSRERDDVDLQVQDAADVVEQWVSDPVRAQEQAARRR